MVKNNGVIVLILALLFLLNNCKEEKNIMNSINVKNLKFEKINNSKVFFGHQSVGNDIISGIGQIVKENNFLKVVVKEMLDGEQLDEPMFFHSSVGENEKPKSKINDFKRKIENGIGDNVNIAFFKFCYIDINHNTDIGDLFSEYVKVMSTLETEYANTNFIHSTIPLVTREKGLIAGLRRFIKKIIGKKLTAEIANIKRNEFNSMLIKKYNGKVFDLAFFESSYLDGSREMYKVDNKTYYSLIPEYTDDGGHLNDFGKKIIAMNFLNFIENQL